MQIYADNAATTKMSEAAIKTMTEYMQTWYGNPSSLYRIGQKNNVQIYKLITKDTIEEKM